MEKFINKRIYMCIFFIKTHFNWCQIQMSNIPYHTWSKYSWKKPNIRVKTHINIFHWIHSLRYHSNVWKNRKIWISNCLLSYIEHKASIQANIGININYTVKYFVFAMKKLFSIDFITFVFWIRHQHFVRSRLFPFPHSIPLKLITTLQVHLNK